MISILEEIKKIRQTAPITIDTKNSNRYRIVIDEPDRTKTAYYFSTPIYNSQNRKLVNIKLNANEGKYCFTGSNAEISFSNRIRMETVEGFCEIPLSNWVSYVSEYELIYENKHIYPTANGFVYRVPCEGITPFSFELEVGNNPFMEVRANDKCFCLMSQPFRPFVTVSCIGTIDAQGKVIAPAQIRYQKLTDRRYWLTVLPCSENGSWVEFEINMYDPKLVQDTTVESGNPQTNNAFGGMAFIGNTEEYGEQWLYSRTDFSKMFDLSDKHINNAVLHIPQHNGSNVELSAFRVPARFCSFGSTWENKIMVSNLLSTSTINNNYYTLDITELFSEPKTHRFIKTDGFILRTSIKGSGFAAISTGDSYHSPQIFEINYN